MSIETLETLHGSGGSYKSSPVGLERDLLLFDGSPRYPMSCPHCRSYCSPVSPFDRALEGGVAYAQTCVACGHVVDVRPRLDTDPPIVPPFLTEREAANLLFVRWRLIDECRSQTLSCVYPPMLRAA